MSDIGCLQVGINSLKVAWSAAFCHQIHGDAYEAYAYERPIEGKVADVVHVRRSMMLTAMPLPS